MTEEQLKKLLDAQAAQITGYLTRHIDGRLKEVNARFDRVDERIDQVQIVVDSIAKRLDTFEQEQTIINARTDSKLDQLAGATSIKWATD